MAFFVAMLRTGSEFLALATPGEDALRFATASNQCTPTKLPGHLRCDVRENVHCCKETDNRDGQYPFSNSGNRKEPVDEDDPVVAALTTMAPRLQLAGIGPELANGNVEAELKLFLASAFRAHDPPYACVADKEFNGAPLDLLALENSDPAFWLEVKCSLRCAGQQSIRKVVIEALAQIQCYSDRMQKVTWLETSKWPQLAGEIDAFRRAITSPACRTYIVDFLNSAPGDADNLPRLITRKYPKQTALDAHELQRLYAPDGDLCSGLPQQQEIIQHRLQNIPDEQIPEAKQLRCADRQLRYATRAYSRFGACMRRVLQNPLTDAVIVRFKPGP